MQKRAIAIGTDVINGNNTGLDGKVVANSKQGVATSIMQMRRTTPQNIYRDKQSSSKQAQKAGVTAGVTVGGSSLLNSSAEIFSTYNFTASAINTGATGNHLPLNASQGLAHSTNNIIGNERNSLSAHSAKGKQPKASQGRAVTSKVMFQSFSTQQPVQNVAAYPDQVNEPMLGQISGAV